MSKDISLPQPEFARNFSRHRLSWLDFAPFVLIVGLYLSPAVMYRLSPRS